MKPHKIVMQNFGSYVQETTVDFDRMGDTVFLITGDTGAGKTTIFDAMIYALYGTASGSGRSGDTIAFHSDFAKHDGVNDEMKVAFTFSNGDHEYVVNRSVNWGKKGTNKKEKKEAILYRDGEQIEYSEKSEATNTVTTKITEILGLDAKQFCQIVMLAQGEFRRFLDADSKTRGIILGKIFDNRMYIDFENRLKAAAVSLSNKVKDKREKIDYLKSSLNVPDPFAAIIPVEQQLIGEFIEQIIDAYKGELDDLAKFVQEQTEEKEKCLKLRNEAETGNKKLEEAREINDQYEAHLEKKTVIDEQREKIELVQKAIYVSPVKKEYDDAASKLNELAQKIEKKKAEINTQKKQQERLEKEKTAIEEKNLPMISQKERRYQQIEQRLGDYENFEAAKSAYESTKNALSVAQNTEIEAKNAHQEASEAKEKNDEIVRTYESISQDTLDNVGNKIHAVDQTLRKLIKLQDDVEVIKKDLRKLERLEKQVKLAEKAYFDQANLYQELLSRYINGQAGVLAVNLKKQIEEQESAVCPVCGFVHTSKDIEHFAKLTDDIPTKEEVDQNKTTMDECEKVWKDANDKKVALETRIENRKNRCYNLAEELELISDFDEEVLLDEDLIQDAISDCEKIKIEQERNLRILKKQLEEKNQALGQREELDQKEQDAKNAFEKAKEAVLDASNKVNLKEQELKHWNDTFAGLPETKKDAEDKLKKLSEQKEALEKEIKDQIQAINDCVNATSKLQGEESSLKAEKGGAEKDYKDTKKAFEDALFERGFDDKEEYKLAASPEGTLLAYRALIDWKDKKILAVQTFDRRTNELRALKERAKDATKGVEFKDLDEFNHQIEILDAGITNANTKQGEIETFVKQDAKIKEDIENLLSEISKYIDAERKISAMSEQANSNYSFNRHVLEYYFEHVLYAANAYLAQISNNKYSLVMKQSGDYDGRSLAGLDFQVFDEFTSKVRETSSLSGGESFEVSLALALGLSQIVQEQSTSQIRIDSMFIDEGFGSLDEESMKRALDALYKLAGGQRQIGLISHVERLEEILPRIIYVHGSKTGSTIEYKTDM